MENPLVWLSALALLLSCFTFAVGQWRSSHTASAAEAEDLRKRVEQLEKKNTELEDRYDEVADENLRLMKKLLDNGGHV